jgi:4-alpha-glucanotransferase
MHGLRADVRSSGILLHPTSLPGGKLGAEAYAFVDWLEEAGQSWWQVLPLGPPDGLGSPYTSSSAFAGWRGLLAEPDAPVSRAEVDAFRARHAFWAVDWERFAGAGALADQVRFEREWTALRRYAAARGIRLVGDLAIYVAAGSADHRFHPELFRTGVVAGAPPDSLSATGQLWGNPLYDWPALRRRGYRWWIERFRRSFELFDLLRVDHFRGFVSYWAVPVGAPNASYGYWQRGPGGAPFRAAQAALGLLPLIAEDLGVITPPVRRLRDELGLPGMAVLQFGFGAARTSPYRPENFPRRLVVYTGTHDTETAMGWWKRLRPSARSATGLDPAEPNWSLIELALGSRAYLAITPAQDLLGLGSAARMNRPGRRGGNWRWRLEPGALDGALAARLRALTAASGRLPAAQSRPR